MIGGIDPQELKKHFINTSWLFVEKGVGLIIGVLTAVLIARYLGPESYGILCYGIGFVFLFNAVATLTLESNVVKKLVDFPHLYREILWASFIARFFMAFAVFVTVHWLMSYLTLSQIEKKIIYIMALTFFFKSMEVIQYFFQSKVRLKVISCLKIFQLLTGAILRLIIVYFKASLIWFAIVILVEEIILAAGAMILISKEGLFLSKWRFDSQILKQLLYASTPLILSQVCVLFFRRIDQIMIKHMLGASWVGNYSLAVTLCEGWYFIPTIIICSVFPAIVQLKKDGEIKYYDRLQRLYDLMVLLGVLIALFLTVFSRPITNFLFGALYEPSIRVMQIYVWLGVFMFLGMANSQWLIVENLQRYDFYRNFICLFLNVILNIILIPKYKITGAAFAAVISFGVATLGTMFLFKPTRRNFWLSINAINPIRLMTHVIWQNVRPVRNVS